VKPGLALTFPHTFLATTSSSCVMNVSLLLEHVSVSNGVQGHCFDAMSLFRLTLLRWGNVVPISVCPNARPKMAPGAAWLLCPLCICLLCLDIDCLLIQLLPLTACLPTTNMIFNKTQLQRSYRQVCPWKPPRH
jgi:hypothetical protein